MAFSRDPERWNRLIEIADTTEINAIVIDVKQDTIYYDTQVPFFRDIDGMVTPIFDPKELLAELDAHGIYSIARMVVFKDPLVAAGRPDLAVRDEVTGEPMARHERNAVGQCVQSRALGGERGSRGGAGVNLGSTKFSMTTFDFPPMVICEPLTLEMTTPRRSRRAAITGAVALGSEKVRATGAAFCYRLVPDHCPIGRRSRNRSNAAGSDAAGGLRESHDLPITF